MNKINIEYVTEEVAKVSIIINDVVLTKSESVHEKGVRDYFITEPSYFVEWLKDNFNEIIKATYKPEDFEWQMSHCMMAIGEGFSWPNIKIYADHSNSIVFEAIENNDAVSSVKFLTSAKERIST